MIGERSPAIAAMAPDDRSDPVGAARYWVRANTERWSAACDIETDRDWVACDTDPFKLHYSWTLWKLGYGSEEYWRASKEFCRDSFQAGTLGIADLILFADLDEVTLRAQKEKDLTSARTRFEVHVQLAPALLRWYEAINRLEPGRVQFHLPAVGLNANLLSLGRRAERTGAAIFDQLMVELEKA
jgi:hypothetical protein